MFFAFHSILIWLCDCTLKPPLYGHQMGTTEDIYYKGVRVDRIYLKVTLKMVARMQMNI